MLRGEFIRGDGLVLPNNITIVGAQTILAAALRNTAFPMFIGLVDGVPDANLAIEDLDEPTIGSFGYARQALTRDNTGWPAAGMIGNEPYLESLPVVFAAVGGNFTKAIRRMMLVTSVNAVTGPVIALSSALPNLYTVTPTDDVAQRTFKYRVFLR